MRILVVQESDWIEKGPHQSHHLMERLSERGHEIRVIDFEIEWRKHRSESIITKRKIVESVRKATDKGKVTVIRPSIVRLPFLDYFSIFVTHRLEIERQLRDFRPDMVIGFGILNSYLAIKACKRENLPFLYYLIDELHNLVPQEAFRNIARMIESYNIRHADLVISINEALREYSVDMGAEIARTRTIRAGIDLEKYQMAEGRAETRKEYGIRDDDIVLFFMGWLYEFSGLREVTLSLSETSDRFPNLRLMILGRGELSEELHKKRDEYGLKNRIVIIDWKPYNEVPRFLAASDICILPAYNNQVMKNIVPIKMYEYMASQKPVIATRLPGLVKEFGEDNGVTYVNEPREVVEKAADLVRKGLIRSEGEKSRAFVQGMDWKTTTGSFEGTLRTITEIETAQGKA